ncbi:glycosyltransferase [Vibrio lentus]
MKILFVITGLGMGGAENLVSNLADFYYESGHEVEIIYAVGEVKVSPKNSSIKLTSLNISSYMGFFKAYFKLRKLIKDRSPDVVHSHMIHANILTRLVRATCYIPKLICTAHSTNEGGKIRMLAYRLTDYLSDEFTNVSSAAVEEFIFKGAVKSNRILSVPNGVDTTRFQPPKPNNIARSSGKKTYSLLSVGRFNESKDYPTLFNAIKNLSQLRNDFFLNIVGDGELQDEMIALAKKLNIDEHVNFLGVRKDVEKLMASCDVFLLSSRYEGFGLVVAEAMSCERIIVATDCGGVQEIVGEGKVLVPVGDYIKFSSEINYYLNLSQSERHRLGQNNRNRIVSNFSLSSTAEQYISLYKR